ncbi:hypothetical protein Tco_0638602 [Tanacetum coccineum]
MKLQWRGDNYKELLWRTATATSMAEFQKMMKELKAYSVGAYEYLNKIPPEQWSKSHFTGRAHYDLLLNNICEVFNKQLVDGSSQVAGSSVVSTQGIGSSKVTGPSVGSNQDVGTYGTPKNKLNKRTTSRVYVAHIPQVTLVDFYLKNLCVDKSDEEVTSKLRTHEKKKKDVDSMSLEELIAWE